MDRGTWNCSNVKGTVQFGIRYDGNSKDDLYGYSGSDYAGDPSDRKSIKGQIFFLASAAVTWASRKAKSVARSTAEAELQALGDTVAEAMWLRRPKANFRNKAEEDQDTVVIFEDNQGAIQLARNGGSVRAKHIGVQQFNFISLRMR